MRDDTIEDDGPGFVGIDGEDPFDIVDDTLTDELWARFQSELKSDTSVGHACHYGAKA